MEFDFLMRLRIDANADLSEVIERLAEAGCDDAVVGVGRPGRVALEFIRNASSVQDAIRSALLDVKRAMPNAELFEISQPAQSETIRADGEN